MYICEYRHTCICEYRNMCICEYRHMCICEDIVNTFKCASTQSPGPVCTMHMHQMRYKQILLYLCFEYKFCFILQKILEFDLILKYKILKSKLPLPRFVCVTFLKQVWLTESSVPGNECRNYESKKGGNVAFQPFFTLSGKWAITI